MKDTHFLYSIATLAIGSILAIFVSLATGTLPTSTPRSASADFATTPAKKDCECCTGMTEAEKKAYRERTEKLQKQRQTYQKAVKLILKHGRPEALRRLKHSDPEIAEQLERFTVKDAATPETASHRQGP
ncbi:hypothetical protein F4167_10995 [Candidatus Poribacteria bacterium]|nr:hypothetical protein [Candidatus Poribacteria bacterium]MYG07122.1 hypothetical protein [Candidatus Poribacteria bacterium]MYI05846.1 hypothetical protein [Gemmatimonadota bacterium]